MLSTRVIPALLLKGKGLVKTTRFRKPVYVGDPMNAVKVFNDKEVDELIFLDIIASKAGTEPDFSMIEAIASECFMPVCYGGGINKIEQIKRILGLGIEKVSLNHSILENPGIINKAASLVGSQSIVVSVDIASRRNGSKYVYSHVNKKNLKIDPVKHIKTLEDQGAGELLLNSVNNDGMMTGYDTDFIKIITELVNIPVIACGGAGNLDHLKEVRKNTEVSGLAAGSMFVFHGKHKAVLLSYPDQKELTKYL
jgi:cyclase